MSYIIYLKKDDSHVYAYQATSYRDPVTLKPKSKRTYIGRVDPITHEFLNPDDAKKLHKDNPDNTKEAHDVQKPVKSAASQNDSSAVARELNKINKTIQSQQAILDSLRKEQKEIRKLFEVIERAIHLSVEQGS